MNNNPQFIQVNQLCVGLFVHLDLGWMDHPFTSSNFKIKDHAQIEKIKGIGLNKLRYDPNRSDCAPIPLTETLAPTTPEPVPLDQINTIQRTLHDEQHKPPVVDSPPDVTARVNTLNKSIAESEKQFLVASQTVKDINHNIALAPKETLTQANTVINDLLDTVLMEGDVVVHAMDGNRASDAHYEHSLNVTVLSLMLAKALDISKEDLRLLGLSAILHDVGKAEVSDAVLKQKSDLSHQANAHYQEHVHYGNLLVKEAGLPARVCRVISEHHEFADGSGYPKGLTVDALDQLSSIIIICNQYDNLCNPADYRHSRTPYEALSYMFAKQRRLFHEHYLKRFIKSLGVYPPNSIVKLSNGEYGTVLSVNPHQPLRPFIRVITESKDENDASSILDLRAESSLSITACLKHSALPSSVASLIKPREKTTYFIGNEQSETKQ